MTEVTDLPDPHVNAVEEDEYTKPRSEQVGTVHGGTSNPPEGTPHDGRPYTELPDGSTRPGGSTHLDSVEVPNPDHLADHERRRVERFERRLQRLERARNGGAGATGREPSDGASEEQAPAPRNRKAKS